MRVRNRKKQSRSERQKKKQRAQHKRWTRVHRRNRHQLACLKRNHDSAYEALFEDWAKTNGEYWEYDWTITDFVERMATFGITLTEDEVQFTGFWSQGDGACFQATVRPSPKLFEKDCQDYLDTPYVAIIHALAENGHVEDVYIKRGSGNYSHKYMMEMEDEDFSNCFDPEEWVEEYEMSDGMFAGMPVRTAINLITDEDLEEYTDTVLDLCRDHAEDLYRDLERDYDYATGHECFDNYLMDTQWKYHAEEDEVELLG